MSRQARPRCEAEIDGKGRCRASPLKDGRLCFFHDPASAEEAARARQYGGLRRRRDHVLGETLGLPVELTLPAYRRVLTIAVMDTLALDNGIARNRTLIAAVRAASELFRDVELVERLRVVELAILGRSPAHVQTLVVADIEDDDDD